MKKRLLPLLLAVLLTATLLPVSALGASDDIVLLYTNDVHCAVEPDEDSVGYTGVAAAKKGAMKKYQYVTLIDAGDAIQGGPIGTLSKGAYLVDIMNEVGYDIATLGNHEFDYGMDWLLTELIPTATTSYVSANFVKTSDSSPVLAPYKIVEYGKTKVAYLGISTPESLTKSTPTFFMDEKGNYIYGFCQDETGEAMYTQVQKYVDAARAEGAQYVIAVAHLGVDEQSAPWRSTDVIAATTGIDAFIDGHSHSSIAGDKYANKEGKEILLTSTGTALAAVGKMVISKDGITSSLISAPGTDKATTEYIASVTAKFEGLLSQVVAKTDVELIATVNDERIVRAQETNLGDLCADAYKTMLDADIAFVNGGGVRANIAAGDITYEQIINVHPFGNMACMVEATGQEILDALEMASRITPELNGGFLQVAGLSYEIHTYIPSSVKVDENGNFVSVDGDYRVKNVKVGDKALDTAKTYTLASHNYMLKSGGDGINMFMDNKVIKDEVMIDNQVLINYIVDSLGGTVGEDYAKAEGTGRIMIYANEADVPKQSSNTLYYVLGAAVVVVVVLVLVLKKKKTA